MSFRLVVFFLIPFRILNQLVPQVFKVNGVKITNLRQLVSLVDSNKEPFLRVELDRNSVITVDTSEATAETPKILADNNITAARSVDLLPAN